MISNFATTNTSAASTNPTDLTYAAATGVRHCIGGIAATAPASFTGTLQVLVNGVVCFQLALVAGGVIIVPFHHPMRSTPGHSLTIRMVNAGTVAVALNALGYWQE